MPAEASDARDSRPVQNVTVHVNNPLSDQNWDAISEEIVEALNRAGDRNVAVSIYSRLRGAPPRLRPSP